VTLGAEFAELLQEFATEDDGFGSAMTWRHIARVEDPETRLYTETATDVAIRAMLVDPVRTRMFSDSTVQQAMTAVVVPGAQLTTAPAMLDQVGVRAGTFYRVLEIKEILGPGDAAEAVLIGYAVALGA